MTTWPRSAAERATKESVRPSRFIRHVPRPPRPANPYRPPPPKVARGAGPVATSGSASRCRSRLPPTASPALIRRLPQTRQRDKTEDARRFENQPWHGVDGGRARRPGWPAGTSAKDGRPGTVTSSQSSCASIDATGTPLTSTKPLFRGAQSRKQPATYGVFKTPAGAAL